MVSYADAVALRTRVDADRDLLWHARAHLFARVSHPARLLDGESYDVDLAVPRFSGLWNGETVVSGPAQLIATWLPATAEWLWGFHNASVGATAWSRIAAALRTVPALETVLDSRTLQIGEDDAEQLAAWIARACGYLGAYPAVVGDAVAFVAVKLSGHPEASVEPADSQWCTLCGRWPSQVAILLSGTHGFVCDLCVSQADEVRPRDRDPNVIDAVPDTYPSCVLCGDREAPRLLYDYTSLCWSCTETGMQIVRDRGGFTPT
jgi:hypothetical protein